MPQKLNVSNGDKYNRWKIIHEVPRGGRSSRMFLCRCDCGKAKTVSLQSLTLGSSKSCGCYKKEHAGKGRITHGMSLTRLCKIWYGIRKRCYNKNCSSYKHYGARGIALHEDWLDFDDFHKWAIENGYRENLTIERINNDGDYSPKNCTWIPKFLQSKNTRFCIKIKIEGKIFRTLRDAAIFYNIIPSTAYSRYRSGLDIEDVLGVVGK